MFELVESLQSIAEPVPDVLLWLAPLVLGAIPFVESYGGSVLAIAVGVHPVMAIAGAIAGNIATMLVFVRLADRVGGNPTRDAELSPRRQKLKRRFDTYGVPATSLIGQTVLPSQLSSAAMVSFGASRQAVIGWQLVAIVLWGVVFGVLAAGVSGVAVAS